MNRSRKMLVVEDNPADLELILDALQADGLEIETAENGELALQHVLQSPCPFDLVFLDLNLPLIDGREVLRQLRASETDRRTPVVILSSSCAQTDLEMSFELGANLYLVKPLGVQAFVNSVRTAASWCSAVGAST